MNVVFFHLNQLGDLMFSLPALKSIRDSFPDAHLTSVVRPSMMELLRTTGLVNTILPRHKGAIGKCSLARTLAVSRIDKTVSFSQSAECAMLAFATRAPQRIGFVGTSAGWLLTKHVQFHHPPSTENNLRLVQEIGVRVSSKNYIGLLKPTAEQIDQADRLLADRHIAQGDILIAIAPGTSSKRTLKRWPPDRFASVARRSHDLGYRVVILHGEPSPEISNALPHIVDLGGKTSLPIAAAVLSRCSALVALDSGILHLGAAVGTKVVGLYGPSNPNICGPQGDRHIILTSNIDCRPCNRTTCDKDAMCMDMIGVNQVTDALGQLLDRQQE